MGAYDWLDNAIGSDTYVSPAIRLAEGTNRHLVDVVSSALPVLRDYLACAQPMVPSLSKV
jgi:hypothetical protein